MLMASCGSVFSTQKLMMIEASFNPTQTDQGVYVSVAGRVFDLNNSSLSNALISIEVISPQGSSVHVAVAYTDSNGLFQDTFNMAQSSPAGNYTAYLTADKPGYDTAHQNLIFVYLTPDFALESSISTLTIQQGQTSSVTLTVLSLRGFNDIVNLTAINQPPGVTIQFSPSSLVPSGSTIVNIQVSFMATNGNYTFEFLGVSGSLTHKAILQLQIEPGPMQPALVLAGALFVIGMIVLTARSRKSRHRREQIVDEFLRQADTGYVATARALARLEELRAMNRVDESTYQKLRKDYEKRLEKSTS
ncbi:MAG TPA: hypothetical protein VE862_08050 [Candidatus Acidoferrum sp.]|nr:hypothetical protein [Candidatus Acidoferrum sp.]